MKKTYLKVFIFFVTGILFGCQQTDPNSAQNQPNTPEQKANLTTEKSVQSDKASPIPTIKPADDIALTEDKDPSLKEELGQMDKSLSYKGTVQFFNLEGGFFGIVTESGEKFLPMGLDKRFMQDGAIIEFQGHKVEDMMTIQQWGTPFKIEKIKLIKPGKPSGKGSQHELM